MFCWAVAGLHRDHHGHPVLRLCLLLERQVNRCSVRHQERGARRLARLVEEDGKAVHGALVLDLAPPHVLLVGSQSCGKCVARRLMVVPCLAVETPLRALHLLNAVVDRVPQSGRRCPTIWRRRHACLQNRDRPRASPCQHPPRIRAAACRLLAIVDGVISTPFHRPEIDPLGARAASKSCGSTQRSVEDDQSTKL